MLASLLSLTLWLPLAAPDVTADPAAEKAFAEFLTAYRAHPSLTATATTRITALDRQGDGAVVESKGESVEITLVHGMVEGAPAGPDGAPQRRGRLNIKDYTCWLGDGFLTAVHGSNPDAYCRIEDDGSPYYALFNCFLDLPYPDLALAFGEPEPSDVLMQLHPKAPDVVPVGVSDAVVEGRPARTIKLAAEGQAIDLVIDPAKGLPITMTLVLTGGPFVTEGTTLRYDHTFKYEETGKPLTAEALAFDPGKRAKVDLFAALRKVEEPKVGPDGQREHALVGKPAPPLSLPLLDGGTFELGALKGKVVVLDFWATWCGPCKSSLPILHEVAAAMRADQAPVTFCTVNVFEQQADPEARRKFIGDFWKAAKHTLPVALDLEGTVGKSYQVPGIPMTVVVRSDGVVHAVHVGFQREKLEEDIKGAIAALESPPAGQPAAPADAAPAKPAAPDPAR